VHLLKYSQILEIEYRDWFDHRLRGGPSKTGYWRPHISPKVISKLEEMLDNKKFDTREAN
jgi:hypothetical protein